SQPAYAQHQGGRDGANGKPAVARLDAHVATLRQVIEAAGIAAHTTIIVTGDHGFQNHREYVYPNHVLVQAGLRTCPGLRGWRAAFQAGGGGGGVFVNPPDDLEAIARADDVLRREAGGRYTVLTRAELDALGALPGAALGLEAAPGWALGAACNRLTEPAADGQGMHGYLPSRPTMATGFI